MCGVWSVSDIGESVVLLTETVAVTLFRADDAA